MARRINLYMINNLWKV